MCASGDWRSSWLKPEVVRLPPAGRAVRGGVGLATEGVPSDGVAGETLGESRALMFMVAIP